MSFYYNFIAVCIGYFFDIKIRSLGYLDEVWIFFRDYFCKTFGEYSLIFSLLGIWLNK